MTGRYFDEEWKVLKEKLLQMAARAEEKQFPITGICKMSRPGSCSLADDHIKKETGW